MILKYYTLESSNILDDSMEGFRNIHRLLSTLTTIIVLQYLQMNYSMRINSMQHYRPAMRINYGSKRYLYFTI